MTPPPYAITAANLRGRDDACAYFRRKSGYPLASVPGNPYIEASTAEFNAWREAFGMTLEKLERDKI
jgi:hypothetical protein